MSDKRSVLDMLLTMPDVRGGIVGASIHSSLLSRLSENSRPLFMAGAASAFVALMAVVRLHQWWAVLWLVADAGVTAVRLGMIRAYVSRAHPERMPPRRWVASYVPFILASTLVPGLGAMACLISGYPQLATLAIMVTAGILGGVAARNAAIPYVAIAQVLLGALPIGAGALLAPKNGWWILLPPLVTYVAAMIWVVLRHYEELVALMLAERKHAELLARFDTALTNIPNGLCAIDRTGKVVIANRQAAELFGASAKMIQLDVSLPEFVEHISVAQLDETARKQLAGQCAGWSFEKRATLELQLHDGRKLEMTCNPISDGGAVILIEDVTERRAREFEMLHLAKHDPLTGLLNRRGLSGLLEGILSIPAIDGSNAPAVLYLDLDGFKQVNDELGHGAGDEVLRTVAARLKQAVRDSDLVARLGGDEMAIVVRRADPASVSALAKRVIRALERPYLLPGGRTVTIGASIGIAFANRNETADGLIARADKALYSAERAGKGTFQFSGKGEGGRDSER
ncbi:diguanylate cyclase domain-containing protein [Paraburkholderia tropica]|uniref:diguanylate cyclase domain-containing protein n=1 Tax=Paraburkholderia tropica TaxID=92647 RepID=UPI003D28BCA9